MNDVASEKPLDYELFRDAYKPHLRPEGMVKQLEIVFGIDPKFKAEFRYLRKFLMADRVNWSEDIVNHLTSNGAMKQVTDIKQLNTLHNLYKTHANNFRIGEFGEQYLDSLEDVALYFIMHDVKSIWLAGAYRELSSRLVDVVSEKSHKNKYLPMRGTMRALLSALLIEVNQIQRCFTMHERRVSKALVQDISKSTFLKSVIVGQEIDQIPVQPPSSQGALSDAHERTD